MDKFQRGIVVITFASLAIYIVLSIVNIEKSLIKVSLNKKTVKLKIVSLI